MGLGRRIKRNWKILTPLIFTIAITLLGLILYKGILVKSVSKEEISQEVKGVQAEKKLTSTSGSNTGKSPTPTSSPSQLSGSMYLGAWTQGFFETSSGTINTNALKNLENSIGKKVAIAHYYRGWEALDSPQLVSELTQIAENGWRPMISVNPHPTSKCDFAGKSIYRAIAEGNCDGFLTSAGKNLSNVNHPFFFRFAWEMNTSSMEWRIGKEGSNEDFINAWRRMRTIFYDAGATNVLFVFSPDVGGNTSYQNFYPGDQFVDWVALDGYNWGTTQSWSKWQNLQEVFQTAYNIITSVAPSKPLMIAEINTTDKGGDKAAWYNDALSTMPVKFPRVKALVFYNEDRSLKENVNWMIDVSVQSLQAFSNGITSHSYLSNF